MDQPGKAGGGREDVAATSVSTEPEATSVLDSPVTRAITLDWLFGAWAELRDNGPYSWVRRPLWTWTAPPTSGHNEPPPTPSIPQVTCEFLPPDHPHDIVSAATVAAHRAARREAERLRNGVPRDVRYEAVPAELLTTTDVVELCVRPTARRTHLSFAASNVPVGKVGRPTIFASHAWGRLFCQLVSILGAHFSGAVASDIYIWLGKPRSPTPLSCDVPLPSLRAPVRR